MSRRLRQEQLKLKQLNAEVQEELDRVKLWRERIYAPVVWNEIEKLNVRIQDLKPSYHEEVLNMIKVCWLACGTDDNIQLCETFDQDFIYIHIQNFYLPEDLLCRNVKLGENELSTENFLQRILFNLKFNQSIIGLDLGTGEVVGVLILKEVTKCEYDRVFSRVQLIDGEEHKKCVKFTNYLNRKVDVYEHFDVDVFLRFYLLCIKEDYRHKRLGQKFFECGVQVARSLKCPVMMGVFPTATLQKLAERVGMRELLNVNYLNWKDEDKEMIFPDPGAGNCYNSLMACEVLPPPPPPPPDHSNEGEPKKLTRVEKLALMAKEERKANRNMD